MYIIHISCIIPQSIQLFTGAGGEKQPANETSLPCYPGNYACNIDLYSLCLPFSWLYFHKIFCQASSKREPRWKDSKTVLQKVIDVKSNKNADKRQTTIIGIQWWVMYNVQCRVYSVAVANKLCTVHIVMNWLLPVLPYRVGVSSLFFNGLCVHLLCI